MDKNSEKFKELQAELEDKLEYVKFLEHSNLTKDLLVLYLITNKKGDFKERVIGTEYTETDFYQNIIHNKKAIVEFCINHPELSHHVLYWPIVLGTIKKKDFAGYTRDQIVKLPKTLREVIVHPEQVYKLKVQHKIDERIFFHIPNENYWEALEWIAKNAPDKLNMIVTKKSEFNPFGRKRVIDHYKNIEDQDSIPEALRIFIKDSENFLSQQTENAKRGIEVQNQKRLAKRLSWIDENGETVQLFHLADGMKITSFEDYKLIANYFMQSNLSVSEFCRVYQIEDVDGFKKMCEKMALVYDEFAVFYKDNLEKKSKAYVSIIKHQIEDIADDKLKISEMLTKQSQMKSLETVMSIGSSTVNEYRLNRFAEKIISYYYQRINSYDNLSTDVDQISKRLTEDEIRFLMPSRVVAQKKKGAEINLGMEFAKPFSEILKKISPASKNRIYSRRSGIYRKLEAYSESYCPSEYISGNMGFMMADGTIPEISQEEIDMAEAFASEKGLYRSAGTMSRIIKAVIDGKIQNQAETESYKQKLQEQILQKMKECKNLEEYFEKYRTM